jgi:rsbT co-antagonist protein RsbR
VLVVLLGVATVLPYAAPQRLTQLLRLTGGVGVILAVLSIYNPLAQPTPPEILVVAVPILVPCLIGAILLLLGLFHRRLTSALAVSQQAVRSLQAAQEQLEAQVQVRTADLQLALQEIEQRADAQAVLLEEVQQQRDTIREMSVPVLPVTRNELVVPLVGALDTVRLAQLREQALAEIERKRTRRLILDVTGVPVVDRFVAQGIVQVVAAARLLGAETALVGIRPEVAQALVGLGVDLSAIRSYADLASALGRG